MWWLWSACLTVLTENPFALSALISFDNTHWIARVSRGLNLKQIGVYLCCRGTGF